MANPEKQVMVVGVDESDHSMYALEWLLEHFFTPFAPNFPFNLVIVYARPSLSTAVGLVGPGAVGVDVWPLMDADLRRSTASVVEKAKEICARRSVSDAKFDVMEGDARNILCEAVEKHHASALVVGNHGYGAIKRAMLGSVSDYCAHHAHCSVMIVKRPITNH